MSRSKKTWDHFVDYYGNYIDLANLGGIQGEKGLKGEDGLEGEKGLKGLKGDPGEDGNDAPPFLEWMGPVATEGDLPSAEPETKGHVYQAQDTGYLYVSNGDGTYTEIQSFDMLKGDKGDDGDEGPEGPKGLKGIEGIQGLKGETGEEGEEGLKGEPGIEGEKGSKGDEGDQGLQGSPGQTGEQGVKGEQGNPGTGINIIGSLPPGDIGPPPAGDCQNAGDAILAEDGRIWICDGQGNWIDGGFLQGPEGPQGIQGIEGPQGPDGPRGNPGDEGQKGEPGIQGIKGSQGAEGLEGAKGQPGTGFNIIGSIDVPGPPAPALCTGAGDGIVDPNGSVWVCDGSGNWTEIPGIPGADGTKGIQGDQGDQGVPGTPGARGPEGPEGPQGVKGDIGPAGAKGNSGRNGEKGIRGNKGETGESPFSFQGTKEFEADLFADAGLNAGDVWYVEETDKFYVWDDGSVSGTSQWRSVPFDATTMPEPDDDNYVYGRIFDSVADKGEWVEAVNHKGDTMSGPLASPGLTTGPNDSDEAILRMDTNDGAYNGGPHELEARSGGGKNEGTDWDAWLGTSVGTDSWQAVAYGNNTWVSVASNTGKQTMWSSDGENWNKVTTLNQWGGVAFGAGLFVAVATAGTDRFAYSSDGKAWTYRSVGSGRTWKAITYGDGQFVAVSQSKINDNLVWSTDGITWQTGNAPQNEWQGIAYGNGIYAAVSKSGTDRLMTSPDGVNWTTLPAGNDGQWFDITYANNMFVAVGGVGGKNLMTSPDGVTWTVGAMPSSSAWRAIAYGAGRWVAGAPSGTMRLVSSEDLVTWDDHTEYGVYAEAIEYADARFIAVSKSGSTRVWSLEVASSEGGLYFDDDLVYTKVQVDPIREKVNALTQAVVNNAETIEVIAPTTFRGLWEYDAQSPPINGYFNLNTQDGTYGGVTEMTIHPVTNQGADYSALFGEVTKHQVITVLRTDAPWGFSARINAAPVMGQDDVMTVQLREVRAIDNPDDPTDIDGLVTIKVQDIIDPKNINEINNILEGLNGSFNNIADYRSVVWTWDDPSLPAFLPSNNAIPEGKLLFHTTYLQLYIRVGGSWLGLL